MFCGFFSRYREQLENDIEEAYTNYRAHNDSKNIFKAANTPITLGAVAMLLYVFSQIFTLLGLTPLSGLLNLAMMVTFLLLSTWCYAKYTGKITEIGAGIDELAVTVWESGLQPVFSRLVEEGSQYAVKKAVERMNSTASVSSKGSQSPQTKKRV